ncbi:signal peptidase I [Veronia nyctiphanis]|uniref:Signal peptidase I n=1 Tax=Veronia nyctiphanis TaxID=1278244 RepID=A0A4Q0YXY4_9GAMM|nr:signal peptidase I [Veronia nyctiphanis]RXJ74069.1 signal peptidase I [Veronia nyctiphanis]
MKKLYAEYRSLMVFIVLMIIFRSSFADWNHVPTSSMEPTIQIGDRILVNKMAYDLRIPLTGIKLMTFGDPERGDIVVFDSEATGNNMVKRVIGTPGDTVEMKGNVLFINGQKLNYSQQSTDGESLLFNEALNNETHTVKVNPYPTSTSSFQAVEVPSGHFLVLGDNRDNSADSRFIGFIPRGEIRGRSKTVVMSFNYDNYYIPRSNVS